jgi:hypothetical protein
MSFNRTNLESLTQKRLIPRIADATFNGSPLAYWLRQNHSIKLAGGRNIVLPLIVQQLNSQWYDGVDIADLEQIDAFNSAQFNWQWLRVPFVIPETDLDKNNGEDGVINILQATQETAEMTIIDALSTALFGTNASDSRVMPGLQDMFGATGTSYGDLLDTDISSLPNSAGSWLSTTVTPLLPNTWNANEGRRMRGVVTKGMSKPNLGVCNFPVYNRIWLEAMNDQRFGMADAASLGFDTVLFEKMPIVADQHATGGGYDSTNNVLMFLNLDYVQFFIHEKKAFATRIYDPLPHQEVWIGKILLGCALTTNNRRMMSQMSTINPSLT